MTKKIDISGEFGEPIVRTNLLAIELLLRDKSRAAREAAYKERAVIVYEKLHKKIINLAKDFEIDLSEPGGWPELALSLAQIYIEGFRVVDLPTTRPGRPRTRSFELYCEIMGRMSGTNHTITAVCRHLEKEKDGKWFGKKYTSLRAEYYELKEEIDQICERGELSSDPEIDRIKEAIKSFR